MVGLSEPPSQCQPTAAGLAEFRSHDAIGFEVGREGYRWAGCDLSARLMDFTPPENVYGRGDSPGVSQSMNPQGLDLSGSQRLDVSPK